MSNGEALKVKDVAALLKVRGQLRFSRKDIDAWVEQQKHTTQDFGEDDQK